MLNTIKWFCKSVKQGSVIRNHNWFFRQKQFDTILCSYSLPGSLLLVFPSLNMPCCKGVKMYFHKKGQEARSKDIIVISVGQRRFWNLQNLAQN